MLGRLDHLTFKGNLQRTRHGWLRLTPAYSVHLVGEVLDSLPHPVGPVLDPFCGTGTTVVACGERGIVADTTDINPFLLWLARAKGRTYSAAQISRLESEGVALARVLSRRAMPRWLPPIKNIEKWWSDATLGGLGRLWEAIGDRADQAPPAVVDLLKVAFCRTLIAVARVSFGHQSMSFRKDGADAPDGDALATLRTTWKDAIDVVATGAAARIRTVPRALACDARRLDAALEPEAYGVVITSPPYPNRMSYVRELRPYMYWLGFLSDGRQAGELDWQAMGGTWGRATSNVARWVPERGARVAFRGIDDILGAIGETSPVLSRYVQKYFHDMALHAASVFGVVRPGGAVHYIVGNSKFYDVLVPVEQILASELEAAGFTRSRVRRIRKRTSKKELFEYVVSASKPA